MRKVLASLSLGMAVLLSGCNTTPYDRATIYYDRAQFATQVTKDFPDIKGPILQHGRCSLLISTPGSTTGTYHFCTFALTQDELRVLGWDASTLKYTELLRVDLTTLNKVALESYFRTNQVQLMEERRQSALSVMIDDGGYHDTGATERVYETLRKRGIQVVKSEGMMTPPAPPTPIIVPVVLPR
ncbi:MULTISPECIES: hypothetical protein [unclassified Pseudomonas]|uniref:hypothetical protein n=1 Tax=unclassified Pseudomonas TaxID=196821 RepID=UPI002447DAFE|nr:MULTISPECIES: hypothetical protein [unclassified Pseudomonas]MDH0303255.1 hypothetical protein [Pseudomonas sp. GD04091]MDH1987477.1 hypothetical protein [Pseudomonas sp. GD03689]